MKLQIKKILDERFSKNEIALMGLVISLVSILFVLSVSTFSGYGQLGQVKNHLKKVSHVSPELYNSALAPAGKMGGKIIPASCSIGYPCDGSDVVCPCPVPTITSFFPGPTAALSGGGTLTWGYTSVNATLCDFSTTMSAPNLGPSYYYVEDPNKTFNNFGPFANANGTVSYTIQCWDAARTMSDSRTLTINLTRAPEVNLGFSTNGTLSPFLNIVSFTGSGGGFSKNANLSWNVNGALSCSASGAVGWTGLVIGLPTGSKIVSYNGTLAITRNYTLSCTNGSDTVVSTVSIDYDGGCFVAGTKVRMADGSFRDIETVTKEEKLQTSSGPGTIEKLWHIPYKGYIYAFNGNGKYFVTDTHPFMTTEGWKSFNPEGTRKENPDLSVSLLEIGDVLLREDGGQVVLEQVDKKYTEETVYNFKLKGSEDFYADGYWVHNALIKPPY